MDLFWRGVGVALLTLFTDDGRVDADATAAHAARLVGLGVRGLLVAGSTGEAVALTDAESTDLVTAVRAACPGVPLLAGASAEWWRPAATRVAAVLAAGADAALVAPPPRVGDPADFYARLGGAPVLAYHYPGVAGGAVPVDGLADLPVLGIKDSSGDPERLVRELDAWDRPTYTGSAMLVSHAAAVGAAGVILAVANAAPEECVAAWDGDGAAQRRLLAAHLAARDRFPHGLKELVAKRFGTGTAARLG